MAEAPKRPAFPWWIILCLIGLDYFSSISYLPSIAVAHLTKVRIFGYSFPIEEEQTRALAPVAALGVVLVTLLAALPVYLYVVGRSPHGRGGIGLLEQRTSGWWGKTLILVLLGFVAADFVLTRSISTSDAAVHVQKNYYYQQNGAWVLRDWMPKQLGLITPDGEANEQAREEVKARQETVHRVAISIVLAVASFGFYFFLVRQLSQGFLGVAVSIMVAYLLLNGLVLYAGVNYLRDNWELVRRWRESLTETVGNIESGSSSNLAFLILLAMITFPPMAIGLSGFELTMASAPLVQGSESDDPRQPWWRILNARVMMVVAALLMCALVLASVFVVSILVPQSAILEHGEVQHRSLSYLAHGGETVTGKPVSGLFGPDFGLLYDFFSVMVLCLAGAAATVSMRDLVPDFLTRFGMQLDWAREVGIIMHLFNAVILLTTVVFRASVTDQQWAYSASVVALLFGASLAALFDVRATWKDSYLRPLVQLPFALIALLFLLMGLLIVVQRPSGILISVGFVAVVMVTGIVSRWLRSTEPRFHEFRFATPEDKRKWDTTCDLDFQIIVPHVRGSRTLAEKEKEIRLVHRIPDEVPLLFVEVEVGDPSEFAVEPIMSFEEEDGQQVIRIREASSVPHTLAAVGLAFRHVGVPPEMHFAWANESPLEANLNFVLLGEGNVPWLVHELIRRAEPDFSRRPRVIVG